MYQFLIHLIHNSWPMNCLGDELMADQVLTGIYCHLGTYYADARLALGQAWASKLWFTTEN